MAKTPQWSARLPEEVKEKLEWISDKERRSQTEEVIYLIEKRYDELKEPVK